MPIPASLSDLSLTPGDNYPAGGEPPTVADDYLRAHAALMAALRDQDSALGVEIDTLSNGKGMSAEVTIASAATCDIGAVNSSFVRISGTSAITSFGTNYSGARFIRFAGALQLTHNATTLILPGGANITTAAGDACIAIPIGTSGWRVAAYQLAAVVPGRANSLVTGRTVSLTGDVTGTSAAFDGSANLSIAATIADNTVTPGKLTQPLTGPAATSTTSGTTVTLTAPPSWVSRITLAFNGVSVSGSDGILIQLGATTFKTSGYTSFGSRMGPGSTSAANKTSGFYLFTESSSEVVHGTITLVKATTGNVWTAFGLCSAVGNGYLVSGGVALSGVLDRIRLTTTGSDTFASGSVGVLYE